MRARGFHSTAAAIALLSVSIAAPATLCATQFYRWTDDSGRSHYSDMPPTDRLADELDIEIKSHAGPARVSTFSESIASAAAVVIYSAQWCGICTRAKNYMDANGIRYTEYDVDESAKGRRDYRRLDGKGVPIIIVGNQRMDGFSASRLQAMLAAAQSK